MGRARSLGSTQQSICLSCHDGHLSCPQSVWEEFFSLLGEEGRKGERGGGGGRKRAGETRLGNETGDSLGKMKERRKKKEKGRESV